MDLNEMQRQVWDNKIQKGFNLTNVEKEFCYLYGEVGEAYLKKKDDLNEEIADIGIYLLGLSNMLGFSLMEEMEKKFEKIKKRTYTLDENGVFHKTEGDS